MQKYQPKFLHGVRGHNLTIDLKFEKGGEASTLMWTPLHFATYFGQISVLKYFIDEYAVWCPFFCLMWLPAESEEDVNSILKFTEDKMYALLLAFESNNLEIFEYLLNRFP